MSVAEPGVLDMPVGRPESLNGVDSAESTPPATPYRRPEN